MTNSLPHLPSIGRAQLMAVVRKSLKRETFELKDWRISQLGGGAGNPVSAGLYRVEGVGTDRGEGVSWSVVLKIIQSPANEGWTDMGEGDDPTHWNYWKRELYVYASDLLHALPEGRTAPRCFGMQELPGNTAWLWLEDIRDALKGKWSLERYALTARHLGRLNGLYAAARPIPAYPWLGANLVKQWLLVDQPEWESIPWEDPRVLARYPRGNAFHKMLVESERFAARLNFLPRTLCHGDTYPTNFMSRSLADGQEVTVVLDWALVNVAPLGDDLAQFVFGAHMNLKEGGREDITNALFESYIEGLRDSGCCTDPRLVRFGFTTGAALRVGLFKMISLANDLKQNNPSLNNVDEQSALPEAFEIGMAEEAYLLMEAIG